jgi:hypothetical protein
MRSILTAIACLTILTGFTYAETCTGRPVDALCLAQSKAFAARTPITSTIAPAMGVSGKFYILDENGNARAEALKDRADRQFKLHSTGRRE